MAQNKYTGFEKASSRNITKIINDKRTTEGKKLISHHLVNDVLRSELGNPLKPISTFVLNDYHKNARFQFCKMIIKREYVEIYAKE